VLDAALGAAVTVASGLLMEVVLEYVVETRTMTDCVTLMTIVEVMADSVEFSKDGKLTLGVWFQEISIVDEGWSV
jgi:hypothetical protein